MWYVYGAWSNSGNALCFYLILCIHIFFPLFIFYEMRNLCSWQGCHCAVVSLHTVHFWVMDIQHWCRCCKTKMRSDLLELWMCVYPGSVWIYFVKFSWDVTMTDGVRHAVWLLLVASFSDCNEISRLRFILCWRVCVLTCQCALTLNFLACRVESWQFWGAWKTQTYDSLFFSFTIITSINLQLIKSLWNTNKIYWPNW